MDYYRQKRRGGRRPGGGRKKSGNARQRYGVKLTKQQADLLKTWGGGDVSAGLRWLVDNAMSMIGPALLVMKENELLPVDR